MNEITLRLITSTVSFESSVKEIKYFYPGVEWRIVKNCFGESDAQT